eukprot:697172-Pleurochrysis_carterae.AAC.1
MTRRRFLQEIRRRAPPHRHASAAIARRAVARSEARDRFEQNFCVPPVEQALRSIRDESCSTAC